MTTDPNILKYMPLYEGEKVSASIKGNAYNFSPHPILALLGMITRILSMILGVQKKINLLVTDFRVITVETQKILWVIDAKVSARTYTPRSITQVGYTLGRSLIFFKGHYLDYTSASTVYQIKAHGGKSKIFKVISALVELPEKIDATKKTQ